MGQHYVKALSSDVQGMFPVGTTMDCQVILGTPKILLVPAS